MRKGLWSPDEDEKLKNCIAQHRSGSWSDIARKADLQRCGKSCRRRWMNHLRPDLKRQKFTPEELKLVAKLHQTLGNKWSEIATYLVGRTDNDVKNLWNTQIKKQSRIFHQEAPFRIKGNDLEGFPFSMDSKLDHMGQLSFQKSQLSIITSSSSHTPVIASSSSHTPVIASSWGPSSVNASNFNSQLEPSDIMEEKHDIVDRLYNQILDCASYEGDHAQMPLLNQHAKLEERLGCTLDEFPLIDNTDASVTPMGCKTQNNFNDGIHGRYYEGDYAQMPLLNQQAKLTGRLGCSLDECPLIDNKDACMTLLGYTTQNSSKGGIHCSYYVPTNLSSMLVQDTRKDKQLDSQVSSSWEGAGSSNESSTSTIMVGDDTCSVSKPSLFELHNKLHFQQGYDSNYHGEDQKNDEDTNCLSRGESWSSSSCEQWALDTLIGTCEKATWF